MSEIKTLKETLEKTLTLWQYLEQTGTPYKADAYDDLNLEYDLNMCPCCDYASQQAKLTVSQKEMCYLCPIWPVDKVTLTAYGCENLPTSPYKLWIDVTFKDNLRTHEKCESRKYYAGEMVKLIKATIDELPKE